MGVLVREAAALYRAFAAGEPSPLPELPVQYADFAVWQRAWLDGDELARQLDSWKEALRDAAPLELPTDRPRPARPSLRGKRLSFTLPEALRAELERLGHGEGATLFMTLLAGFAALLHRHSGQDDLCVGTPVAGRTRLETEPLIGFFVNTLVLRADLSRRAQLPPAPDPRPPRRARRLRPPGPAVREARRRAGTEPRPQPPAAGPGHVRAAERAHARAGRARPRPRPARRRHGHRQVRPQPDRGAGRTRSAGHLRVRHRPVRRRPHRAHGRPPAQPARGRRRRSGRAGLPPAHARRDRAPAGARGMDRRPANPSRPTSTRLHDLFAEQAARRPDAVAVSSGAERLTYAELAARSTALARRLRAVGVRPETPVGMCVGRSADLVVAVLGILEAGGAYVPLDPTYPAERLAFVIEDSAAPVVVTQRALRDRLPAGGRTVLVEETAWPAETADSDVTPVSGRPDSAAYIIYTSGSTGRPKGVAVAHRQVVALIDAGRALFGFDERDVWPLFHSVAFDFSVWELWGALAHGGRVVIVPQEMTRSPDAFRDLLATEKITVLNQTPSAFRELVRLDEAVGAPPLALRHIILGGEALDPASLRPWFDRHGDEQPRVTNLYGITETTVVATHHRIARAEAECGRAGAARAGSPIGVPLPHVGLLLLDSLGQPVPIGVRGEIHIGGASVARGYLDRAELTAERFVPDPFRPGERLYRSGDLARYRPDGVIEFLGRADHQVKVRGYRIETGEIEAALLAHPAVRECAVVARDAGPESGDGERRLVAYLIASADVTPTELRDHLAARLPDHMLPAAFVAVDRFPHDDVGQAGRARPARSVERATRHRGRDRPGHAARGVAGRARARRARPRRDRRRGQLLRPRRPLAARGPPGVAHPRRPRRRAAGARGVRGADGARAGRAHRAGRRRPRADRAAARPGAAHRPAAAVVRPAAAVVPRPAGPRQPGLQRPGGAARPRPRRSRRARGRPGRGRAPPRGAAHAPGARAGRAGAGDRPVRAGRLPPRGRRSERPAARPSARRAHARAPGRRSSAASIWRARRCCGRCCCAWPTTTTCWS